MQQPAILLLFISLAAIATIVFVFVFITSLQIPKSGEGMSHPIKKRFWFSLVLFVLLAIFASATIPKSPFFLFSNEAPARVIHVATMQFNFLLSEKAIDPESPSGEAIQLPVDKLIEFRVTSMDVNHGFAIYDSTMRLTTQVQAMPGYVNRLRYKFKKPGTYKIICLEYCGIGHQVMQTSFTVN